MLLQDSKSCDKVKCTLYMCVCECEREWGCLWACVCVCAAFCNIEYCATHLNSIKLQRQLHKTRAAKQAPRAYNNVKQDDDDDTQRRRQRQQRRWLWRWGCASLNMCRVRQRERKRERECDALCRCPSSFVHSCTNSLKHSTSTLIQSCCNCCCLNSQHS